MSQNTKIAKMFGALVLGSGVMLSASTNATPPEKPDTKPPSREATPEKPPENPYCQLEFTLLQYEKDNAPPIPSKTCLDGKSDAEILKIINEAKKKTCQSPFCGCWLG